MICFPNAKINIGLNIVEKRPDGFHNIETIFYPIDLKDVLEFVESDSMAFNNSGIAVDGDMDSNLCIKAYNILAKNHDLPKINIHLHKVIPFGAGLGGGSSDAAFMLNALNTHFDLNLTTDELKSYASEIGSDCAFFVENTPAFARGKGNMLNSISLDLKGYYLVLINPGIHISTPEAYANVVPQYPETSLKELIKRPIETWEDCICNDFENSIFPKYPEIKEIKDKLYRQGAVYAAMSGSGSSVFGIFKEPIDIKDEFSDCFFWSGAL